MHCHIKTNTWECTFLFLVQEKDLHTKHTVTLHKFIEAVWLMVDIDYQ